MAFQFKNLTVTDLTGQRAVLSLHRIFIELTGSHTTALFLSEAIYWQQRAEERGESEFYMSLDSGGKGKGPSWADYSLTRSHIDSARSLLEPVGILQTRIGQRNGQRTTLYRLDLAALDAAIGDYKVSGQRIQRVLNIPNWHTWRKLGNGRPCKDLQCAPKQNKAVQGVRAAGIFQGASRPGGGKKPPVTPGKPPSPLRPSGSPGVANPVPVSATKPTSRTAKFDFPIAIADWKMMDRIDRMLATEQARQLWKDAHYLTACILGYEEIVKTTSRKDHNTRTSFTPELIAYAKGKFAKANVTNSDGIGWIVKACNLLDESEAALVAEGGKRLDELMIELDRLKKASQRQHQQNYPAITQQSVISAQRRTLRAIEELVQMTDIAIVHLYPEEVPKDIFAAAQYRNRQVHAKKMRPRLPGEPCQYKDNDLYLLKNNLLEQLQAPPQEAERQLAGVA